MNELFSFSHSDERLQKLRHSTRTVYNSWKWKSQFSVFSTLLNKRYSVELTEINKLNKIAKCYINYHNNLNSYVRRAYNANSLIKWILKRLLLDLAKRNPTTTANIQMQTICTSSFRMLINEFVYNLLFRHIKANE